MQNKIIFDNTVEGDDDDIINIKIVDFTGNIVYYNSYLKKDFPNKFIWNGRNKDLEPLPEGKYTYIVEGEDRVGNRDSKQITGIMLKTGLEKVSVQADLFAFSPKNMISNKITFTPYVTSKDNIIDFEFSIRDDKSNAIRTIVTNCYIDRLEWNGTDSSKNLARDGVYSYQLKVKYDYGNEMLSAVKFIKLITKAPEIEIKADDYIFSPNGDGNKETFTIRQHAQYSQDILYEGKIIDLTGKPVRSYKWIGSIPAELVWDGTDDKGNPVGEGYYKYEISGYDIAGNKTVKTIDKIKLVTTFEKLSFTSDLKAFSPSNVGIMDNIKFIQVLSSKEDLQISTLTIYDSTANEVRHFSKKGDMEREIIWDGKNDRGVIQPDGLYNAEMVCIFNSGNVVKGEISNIIIDKVPPSYKLTVSPDLFTPDGAGENETLYINLELSALAGIKEWEINIYKKLDNGNLGRNFKRFSGTNDTIKQIKWDGYSDDGQDLVESVQDYILELKAEDNVGNKLTNVQREINVGVLVEKTPDGLRIRVSSIQFGFDRADLVGNSEQNLDKVIYIIRKILSDRKKYGITDNYRVEVSGYTDDIGTDEYNQKLSERRAEAVYQYLIMKDIDPKILSYAGYGKSRPCKTIMPDMQKEKKDEYRARNRRVEFFIRR
jgi:outer membrane protein OmpA-like peptidoglycan-associated protein/flagellar hook assembly protein FlgD